MRWARVALAGLVWVGPAQAQAVVARDVWARATPPGAANGVVYMTLTSPIADRLVRVASPAAMTAGLHETLAQGDVVAMRGLPGGIALPPGQAVMLRPGGVHVMLEGLTAPLVLGSTVSLHLTFAHAAPVDVVARVRPIGAAGPDEGAMPGMDMGR